MLAYKMYFYSIEEIVQIMEDEIMGRRFKGGVIAWGRAGGGGRSP